MYIVTQKNYCSIIRICLKSAKNKEDIKEFCSTRQLSYFNKKNLNSFLIEF